MRKIVDNASFIVDASICRFEIETTPDVVLLFATRFNVTVYNSTLNSFIISGFILFVFFKAC